MIIMHRFNDKGKYNKEFQNEISVICPKYSELAIVQADSSSIGCKKVLADLPFIS